MFRLSRQVLSAALLILRRTARYNHKITRVFMPRTSHSCQISIKLSFSPQIFKKYSNKRLHEYPFSGSRFVACGQTDRQTDREESSLFTILRTRLKMKTNFCMSSDT